MTLLRSLLLATSIVVSAPAFAEAPSVVTSIKPVHSLVSGVMKGVGDPLLIVDGTSSPHSYSLRPSQAAALQKANVVFWVSPELEAFLEKPIETLGSGTKTIELIDAANLHKLPFREGETFEGHDHDDHHDEEKHTDHDKEHDHNKHDEHETHGEHASDLDPHIWLDPENAKIMVKAIEQTLSKADPEHAESYKANASALNDRLDALVQDVSKSLDPVKEKPFLVFHDAYQYFENRFGLKARGSITVNPEVSPGAKRIKHFREKIKKLGAACVFSEPQFDPKLVSVVIEGTQAQTGTIDPLGASLDAGPEQYFDLIQSMAGSFQDCLSAKS